jgi:hypothetical protein
MANAALRTASSFTTKLEGGGIKIADGAQPGLLSDLGSVIEQSGDHDVEQVEHIVLRSRFQRPHEGEQRRHAPLQRHSRYSLRFCNACKPGKRRYPAGRHMVNGRQATGQHTHFIEPADGSGQLGTAAQVGAITQAVERAGAASVASDQ